MLGPVHTPTTKRLSGSQVLGWAAAIVGVLLVVLVVQGCDKTATPRNREEGEIAPKARMKRQFYRFGYLTGKMLANDSAFQASVSGLSASETKEKVNAKMQELRRFSLRRLNSKDQVRRVVLTAVALNGVSDEMCADAGSEAFALALGLDSAGVEELISFALADIQDEIRGTSPVLRTDSTAIAWAKQTIMTSLPPVSRQVFSKEVDSKTPLTAADLCTVNRAIFGRILALPESQQPDYARAVVTWVAAHNN